MTTSPRRSRTRRAGFSLVELMVAGVITAATTAMVLSVFVSQQRSFQSLEVARTVQTASRDALLELEPSLRRAGFGVDPRWALDFRHYRCTSTTGTPCRDRIDGPDELVFVARNPNYVWQDNATGTCTTAGGCYFGNAWTVATLTPTFSINARKGDAFVEGRVLSIACPSGQTTTMATLDKTLVATQDGPLELSLRAAEVGNPYRENNFTPACFSLAGTAAFLVERSRYVVQAFSGVPYLMLDTGLDHNRDGRTPDEGDDGDLLPIAPGIEDLQVAYVYARPPATVAFVAPDSNRNWVAGDVPATVEQPDPTAAAPEYVTPLTDARRFNLHPANVRAVRLSLAVRSTQTDSGPAQSWKGDALFALENRKLSTTASLGRYRRTVQSTTVTLRNMESRSVFTF